jgi:prephenate dehydrogenase
METLVVGAGEMGRWFAGCLAPRGPVAFADTDPDAARAAADEVGGRAVALAGDERFDAVCVAVPIPAVGEAVGEQAPRAREAVVDVTGVMEPAVAAMREHAPDRERLSLHPLFAAARAPGRVATVVDAGGPTVERVREALADAGNESFETTPAEHDRAMATVQARAHAAVLAFGLAREAVPDPFHTPVSEELTALVEQVTGGTPRVYADIQEAFEGAGDVAAAAERVAEADAEAFERLYREAREPSRREASDDGDPEP